MMRNSPHKLLIIGKNEPERQSVSHALEAAHQGDTLIHTADSISQAAEMGSRDDYRAVVLHPGHLLEHTQNVATSSQELRELKERNEKLERENGRLQQLYQTAYRFVDNVSHEFRTPLTVIKEFTSILRDGLDGTISEQQREHLEIVSQRVNELTALVNEMFELSQLETGKLVVRRAICPPEQIVARARGTLQRKLEKLSVALDVHLDDHLPQIYCDAEKASRVLVNLADHLASKLQPQQRIQVRVYSDEARWQVVVEATATGLQLESEELNSIVERFDAVKSDVRSSPRGLDLGLNIAKELVQLNLGEIAVESTASAGTRYRFTIPVADIAKVAGRYLERLRQLRGAAVGASLVAASIDRGVPTNVAGDVDQFLQEVVRCTDLVFRLDGHSWLLLTAGQSHDAGAVIDRIEQKRQQTNRNRPGTPLPEICLGVRDRWIFGHDSKGGADEAKQQPSPAANKPRRILLVDDDRDVVQGAAIRLQASGFDVLTAYNGQQAIERVVECQPDAVLLDICMPVMNGLEVLAELRRRVDTRNVPVAIMSGHLSDKDRATQLGASYFVEKPYETNALIAAVTAMTAETANTQ